jgi:hypothetical protein
MQSSEISSQKLLKVAKISSSTLRLSHISRSTERKDQKEQQKKILRTESLGLLLGSASNKKEDEGFLHGPRKS